MRRPVGLSFVPCLLVVGSLIAVAGAAQAESDPFADCEATFAAEPDDWKACTCFYGVAIESNLRREAAARLGGHLDRDPGNPCLASTLGRLHLLEREAAAAAPLLRQAADVFADRSETAGEVYALLNLAAALAQQGASGTEIGAPLDRAEGAAASVGDRVLGAEVALKRSQLLMRRGGDLGQIEDSLRWVRREAFAEASAPLKRDTLLSLGEVLYGRGRFAEAEEAFAEAVEVTAQAGDRFGEAAARLNRAAAVGAQPSFTGQRDEVAVLLVEAMEAAQTAGNRFAEIEARKRLGRLLEGDEGRRHLDAALALADGLRGRVPELLAGVQAATAMSLLAEDPQEARRLVDEASLTLLEAADPWSQVYGWNDRLPVLWETSPRSEALAAANSILAIVERLEEIQSTETARLEVSSVWTEIYQWLSGRLLLDAEAGGDEGALAEAFAVAERMRSRRLLESLAAGGVGPTGGMDAEQQRSWLAVERAIVDLHRRLLDPRLDDEQRGVLLLQLEELESEEDRLAVGQRVTTLSQTNTTFLGLEALRAGLASDEAVLAFQTGRWQSIEGRFDGGSWLLVVTATGSRLHRLPDPVTLTARVDLFVDLFKRRDGSERVPAAALHEALLTAALDELPQGVTRLIAIPDGPLHRLPFPALHDTLRGAPLAARYEISQVPSATAWWRLRERSSGAPRALALADPILPTAQPSAGDHGFAQRSWTEGLTLAPLPYARREGRSAIRRLRLPGDLLLGAEASERAVKVEASNLRLLHVGAHSVFDETHPQRSAVVLAAGGPEEDGLLRPREAAALGLDGAVVVLASCQSAQGRVLRGEGSLSLARAFLAGGARTVVGSLWPLVDEESAQIFDRFYVYLGRGQPVARALALAQRDSLDAGAPAVSWAGLIVLGDGEATIVPARPDVAPPWLLAVLVVLAVVLVVVARVRRRRARYRSPARNS